MRCAIFLFLGMVWLGAYASANPLIDALRRDDLKSFESELARGADANAPDTAGFSPLFYATRDHTTREMKLLLDRGAQANYRTGAVTAFNFAVDDLAKARLLVERGFDFKAEGNFRSALELAARHPRGYRVLNYLLSKGAKPDKESATVLNQAVESGNLKAVELLLEHGAKVNGAKGRPLHTAIAGGNDAMAQLLMKAGAGLNESDDFHGHSLAAALINRRAEIARELLEAGADPKLAKGYAKMPPIVLAGMDERGGAEIAKLLLARGADINGANEDDETLLRYARRNGATELVKFLQDRGAKDGGPNRRQAEVPNNDVRVTEANRDELLKGAVARSVAILAKGSDGFLNREGRNDRCISCHHQTLPGIAFAWAKQRGIATEEALTKRQNDEQLAQWRRNMRKVWTYDDPVPGVVENISFGLLNLAAHQHPADDLTEAMSFFLAEVQMLDGGWSSFHARPPMEASRVSSSALALRALQLYPPREKLAERERREKLAREFFEKQEVFTTDDRIFQLLGLHWAGAEERKIARAARELAALQRGDGGWAQLPTLESDAYATGQVLVALFLTKQVRSEDPRYGRGLEFLLRTQFADGSWLVKTRTWAFQAHFSTGFPHGKDQWISAAATAYAAMALMTGMEGGEFASLASKR